MMQLIIYIICWVIVIKANLEWDGTMDVTKIASIVRSLPATMKGERSRE